MSLIKLIYFKSLGDDRGDLISLEANGNIPFDVKRIYYIFGTKPRVSRGFHAHKKLKQVAICLSGQCRFTLDDGHGKEEVILNNPAQGLLIDSVVWREIHDFSDDCVLVVIASEHYDEDDYIRNYANFLTSVNCNVYP